MGMRIKDIQNKVVQLASKKEKIDVSTPSSGTIRLLFDYLSELTDLMTELINEMRKER